ncbi:MAG: peptidylprolyl isomerase [Candidatus Coproplasma sp.]
MSNPIATIVMENGKEIKLELYPDKAPNTVNNFISLANSGFYNGLIFHRVIKGFMIQGGDPKGVGTGGPGYCIKGEFSLNGFKANDIKHARGVISMARAMSPNSAGSQFFIMHDNASYLDGQYAAFGKVVSGIETVDEIASVPTNYADKPKKDQVIKSISVETYGVEYPQPEKV